MYKQSTFLLKKNTERMSNTLTILSKDVGTGSEYSINDTPIKLTCLIGTAFEAWFRAQRVVLAHYIDSKV